MLSRPSRLILSREVPPISCERCPSALTLYFPREHTISRRPCGKACIWEETEARMNGDSVYAGWIRVHRRAHRGWYKNELEEGKGFTNSCRSRPSAHSHHTSRHQQDNLTSCPCRPTQMLRPRRSRTSHALLVKASEADNRHSARMGNRRISGEKTNTSTEVDLYLLSHLLGSRS